MQNNDKVAKTQSWLTHDNTTELHRDTVQRFALTLEERNPKAASTLQRLKSVLEKAKAWTKEIAELLNLFVEAMEGANESLAERLGIEPVDCASNPANLAEMQAAVAEVNAEAFVPADKAIRYLVANAHPDLQSAVEGLQFGLRDDITCREFIEMCNSPVAFCLLAELVGVDSEDAQKEIRGLHDTDACDLLRSEYGFDGEILTAINNTKF